MATDVNRRGSPRILSTYHMAEIRTYEGTAEELRDFVVRVWRESYGGRMAFPLWTADYLRWQLGIDPGPGHDPDQLLAAYDGGKLIGTVLGFPTRYRTPAGELAGSQGSWLSVDREYRRQGIATQLRQELRRRHAERGLAFQIGYGYFGSPHSLGPSFWESQRELGTVFLNRVGFWARVLDARKAAAWNLVGWERVLTQGFGWMILSPREKSSTLTFREYRADDLSACHGIIDRETSACELAILWDDVALQRQLSGGGVGETVVAEKDGHVCGFVNWHCLPFLGRTEEVVAVVDLVAWEGLSLREQHQLMNAALHRMRKSGAALALKLRIGDHHATPFMTTGFVPRWPDSYVLATWGQQPPAWPSLRRMHLLWR